MKEKIKNLVDRLISDDRVYEVDKLGFLMELSFKYKLVINLGVIKKEHIKESKEAIEYIDLQIENLKHYEKL